MLGLAAAVFYFLYRASYCTGDACIYIDNAMNARYDYLPLHISYYLIGTPIYWFASLLGTAVDSAFIVLSNLLGGVCVALSYLLFRGFSANAATSTLAAAIYALAGYQLQYSLEAEVYTLQIAALLAAMLCVLKGRYALGGAFYALAALTTPVSAFASLFFLAVWLHRRDSLRQGLMFVAAFAIVYLPFFVFIYEELLWGTRGLLLVVGMMPVQPLRDLIVEPTFVLARSFHVLLPVLLLGAIVAARKQRLLLRCFVAVVVGSLYPVLKGNRQLLDSALLPLYPILALLAAHGIVWIADRISRRLAINRSIRGIITGAYVLAALLIWVGLAELISPKIVPDQSFQQETKRLRAMIGEDGILIATFWDGVAYAFYSRDSKDEPIEASRGASSWVDIEQLNRESMERLFDRRSGVYVLESYKPSAAAKWLYGGRDGILSRFLGEGEMGERYEKYSILTPADRLAPNRLIEHVDGFDVLQVGRLEPVVKTVPLDE